MLNYGFHGVKQLELLLPRPPPYLDEMPTPSYIPTCFQSSSVLNFQLVANQPFQKISRCAGPLQGFCFQFSAHLKKYWLLKKQCAQRNAYTPPTEWILISWGWDSVREIFHEMYKTY